MRARSRTRKLAEDEISRSVSGSRPDAPSPPEAAGSPDIVTELDAADASPDPRRDQPLYLMVRRDDRCDVLFVRDAGQVTIGRAQDATIVVDETRVSREHARIHRRESDVVLEDLGSRNGTRINGEVLRAGMRQLHRGDVVRVGNVDVHVAGVPEVPQAAGDGPAVAGNREDIIAIDAAMAHVIEMARRVAKVPTTVLLLGETGVGKEVIAEQIHCHSQRCRGPFVRLNCASIPESLLESELFGYEKGAFTGAGQRRQGFLESANGGTILLDEIGELPPSMQAKLLRVLENRRVMRLGSREEIEIDVRFVCATNRDLAAEVAAGRFRQDLFYRVGAFTLKIPPLRERPVEIRLLAELFASRFAHRAGLTVPRIDPGAVAILQAYRWPGNVRELQNAIEHAMVLAAGSTIVGEHLPEAVRQPSAAAPPRVAPEDAGPIRDQLAALERRSIEEALSAHNGNQTLAAERLGISRRTLLYKLAKYRKGQ